MATRFGSSGPAHSYAAKVRWLVGGLIAVIFVLVVTLFVLSKSSPTNVANDPQGSDVAVASPTPASPTVQILYAAQRIEKDTSLLPTMFIDQDVSPDQIPEGAILARDKATLVGKYSKSIIQPSQAIRRDDITDAQPLSQVIKDIPVGYRAVTITVDSRSGVEGWARPGTRVDVIFTYVEKGGQKKVATIVPFSKILSVGGATSADGAAAKKSGDSTTVTLLVTEKDSKKIELSRSVGTLSLSLVGDQETGATRPDSDPISLNDLFPQAEQAGANAEPEPDGVMYVQDPNTGRQVKYVLQGRRWKKAEDEG